MQTFNYAAVFLADGVWQLSTTYQQRAFWTNFVDSSPGKNKWTLWVQGVHDWLLITGGLFVPATAPICVYRTRGFMGQVSSFLGAFVEVEQAIMSVLQNKHILIASVINFLVYFVPNSKIQRELSGHLKILLGWSAMCHKILFQLGHLKEIWPSSSAVFNSVFYTSVLGSRELNMKPLLLRDLKKISSAA